MKMKKKWNCKLFLSAMLMVLLVITSLFMTGCGNSGDGGSGSDEGGGDSNYETQTVILTGERDEQYWEITVTNDEVVFNEEYQEDEILISVTARNLSEEAAILDNDVIATATQNGNNLSSSSGGEDTYEKLNTPVEPGDSVELVYARVLEDYSQVQVEFHGYTSYVTGGTVVFDVEGRQTEEAKAAAEAEAAKRDARSLDIEYVTADIADGWYIDESDDDSAKIAQDGEDKGYLRITVSFADSPKAAAERNQSLYADAKISTVIINGTEYQYLEINDSQFELYAACSNGDIFVISGMFVDLDTAMPQMEKITVK